MKKGISEARVQRMRNLITKKYGDKTQVRSGYTKGNYKRQEGDVWEEKGKQWTIKNGIKRTINTLNSAREHYSVPLSCPKCSGKMRHEAHKHTYRRWGMCFICTSKWEQEMKISGTYDDFIKSIGDKNFDVWLADVTKEYYEWLSSRDAQKFVTEAGDIEDWSGGKSTDELRKEFDEQVTKIQEARNEKK
jgi:hypothetical protein